MWSGCDGDQLVGASWLEMQVGNHASQVKRKGQALAGGLHADETKEEAGWIGPVRLVLLGSCSWASISDCVGPVKWVREWAQYKNNTKSENKNTK